MRFVQFVTTRYNVFHIVDEEHTSGAWAFTVCGLQYSIPHFNIVDKDFEGNFCERCNGVAESHGWVTGVKRKESD
jgi:hypothetical protein